MRRQALLPLSLPLLLLLLNICCLILTLRRLPAEARRDLALGTCAALSCHA